ncbi:uncharacterized protein SPAPADRAFT_61564 [Spathaspora passalidarum NRRL Y-27907]|uniref:Trafficking protein particle complex III-specific subunit 85 n=1 Tax=Spathaspora passalidarum (strain NRRL Y-27907 / 11-Y1) TaxID=619300 RepID=G3ANC1_SPAPN|nr:uncharacterized protein SPAPADRAFT_61564 [Spathaspora passalidarum NRRL Y-27907]EGW32503.1 hypothetical protein SPAPADRAFT_61564 [Spathaspora passalidarum NRRL Y-27907]
MFGHMVGNDDLLLPFETFNHPISQVFVISMQDSIDELRNMIVKFRNHNYPLYFQMNDLLFHVVILYQEDSNDVISFQNEIKSKLNLNSTVIPIETTVDTTIRYKLNEFIVKNLIPHIQMKIRLWDDQYLQPKKSITNRFISVSKRFFNNNSDSQLASSTSTASTASPFNYNENYYYKGSSQQVLRKLADWSLMINDFKYAYTIYDLIKKDYSQDKAWIYVASTQEMCIVSLLLAQTDQSSISGPDKNTLRKIRHDIIEPFMDNLTYTYKSRFNYTHLNRKCLIIVIELLLCMNKLYNLSYWWIDLIELYLLQLVDDIEHETQGQHSIIKALFYERLGYSFGHYYIPPIVDKSEEENEVDEEEDVNPNKLVPPVNNSVIGLTRFRKSSLWYLLSIREWLGILDKSKLTFVIDNINVEYQVHDSVIKEILQG